MNFLDFEQPVKQLFDELERLKANPDGADISEQVAALEKQIQETRIQIYSNLTVWQRIQVSRHPDRPYSLFYIQQMCTEFIEQAGDRNYRDDKSIVGGFGNLDGKTYMFIGHQKGTNTKMRQLRNFGMPHPEGYRKAMRLMKLAEKFNKPIVTLIDTPGAYPGEGAEQRGQAEAIAHNLYMMSSLKVPVLCIVIGEGASGGALGIGVGDRLLMLQNTWYSVISPEACSSILWRTADFKEKAAEALKPTAQDLFQFKIIDGIVDEPIGGAHANPDEMAATLKQVIKTNIAQLESLTPEQRVQGRIDKYSNIGVYETINP
jgi:acetyl-CoA carboxylase carboxyl transferase subunit alpha